MNDKVNVRPVETHHEMEICMALRVKVFVEEQGVPPELEIDEHDTAAVHAVALVNGHVVGTGRLFTDSDGITHIGRMAVDASYRRQGIGGMILALLEDRAHNMGIRRVTLDAQTYVMRFYQRHGYRAQGETFMEAGIEHVSMTKRLDEPVLTDTTAWT